MFSRRTDIATGSEQFDARAHMSPGVFRQVREKTTLGFFTGTVPLDKPAGKQGPKDLPLLSPATSTAVVKEVHIQIILRRVTAKTASRLIVTVIFIESRPSFLPGSGSDLRVRKTLFRLHRLNAAGCHADAHVFQILKTCKALILRLFPGAAAAKHQKQQSCCQHEDHSSDSHLIHFSPFLPSQSNEHEAERDQQLTDIIQADIRYPQAQLRF